MVEKAVASWGRCWFGLEILIFGSHPKGPHLKHARRWRKRCRALSRPFLKRRTWAVGCCEKLPGCCLRVRGPSKYPQETDKGSEVQKTTKAARYNKKTTTYPQRWVIVAKQSWVEFPFYGSLSRYRSCGRLKGKLEGKPQVKAGIPLFRHIPNKKVDRLIHICPGGDQKGTDEFNFPDPCVGIHKQATTWVNHSVSPCDAAPQGIPLRVSSAWGEMHKSLAYRQPLWGAHCVLFSNTAMCQLPIANLGYKATRS